ncbi:hypothetical protein QET40_10140 [Akkermansia sp. N21169]|nr:hypothetical protein [Akkermansia sp. N21169]
MKKIHTYNTNKTCATNHVAKTIINNSNLINAKQTARKIGLLKQDMERVKIRNMFAYMFTPEVDGKQMDPPPYWEYVYFTIPVTKVKHSLYKRLFNPNINSGPLSQKMRAKITPIFEDALTSLGIESIPVPPSVLKENKINSIFKVEINSPAFKLLIEKERTKKPHGEVSFLSAIGDLFFCNTHSKNEEHPRVYNMFTKMSSVTRKHVFKNIYGVNMVEIDLTNSIVQCLASRGKCTRILEAIRTNTLLPHDNVQRDEAKENLLKWIFTIISPNEALKELKVKRKNQLKEFLSERFLDEVVPFIQAVENLESTHTLFHYEDILREFCKQNAVCINIYDAVYIPADRTDLIGQLTSLLDSQNYFYKVNTL